MLATIKVVVEQQHMPIRFRMKKKFSKKKKRFRMKFEISVTMPKT